MYEQVQKEKFVNTLVNNVGYFNKDLTIKQINQFLKNNASFTPREAVRADNKGSFISFIQLTGLVAIQSLYTQMYIGIPIRFPISPPVFLISIDRNSFIVSEQKKLLQYNLIAYQKNQRGEDFIRLRFPIAQKQWNPRTQNLSSVFMNLMQIINRPPILQLKQQNKPKQSILQLNKSYNSSQKKNRINSQQVIKIVSGLHDDMVEILIGKQNLLQANQSMDYGECRHEFMKNHLQNLKTKLIKIKTQADVQSQSLKKDLKDIQQSGQLSKFLEINPKEIQKLQIMSEQQALKQAEVKLRSKMEKDSNTKFSDYKKIMKVLYQKMFDNQTKLLKSVK